MHRQDPGKLQPQRTRQGEEPFSFQANRIGRAGHTRTGHVPIHGPVYGTFMSNQAVSTTPEKSPPSKLAQVVTLRYALEAFRRARGFTDAELALWLSISADGIGMTGSLRRPEPDEPDFNCRCAEIARLIGCDDFALRILLRWLRASG